MMLTIQSDASFIVIYNITAVVICVCLTQQEQGVDTFGLTKALTQYVYWSPSSFFHEHKSTPDQRLAATTTTTFQAIMMNTRAN